jgi:hypothetical protein
MIVLDEQLNDEVIKRGIERWYRGRVITINELRPKSRILDDAVPGLLRLVKEPTFVTINFWDFWKTLTASTAYCAVCLKLSPERSHEAPSLLRHILKLESFNTKRKRMGLVISWSDGSINYYSV